VTFVRDTNIIALNGDDERCLVDLGESQLNGAPTRLVWGPQADRVLVDGDRIVVAGETTDTVVESGFFAENIDVEFSTTSGKRVVGVTRDGLLKKRDVGDSTNVTVFDSYERFILSTYHPSGEGIAVVVDLDFGGPTLSIELVTNDGVPVRQLVDASNAIEITEMRFSPDGEHLYFIGRQDDGWHLNDVNLLTQELSKVTIEQSVISNVAVPVAGENRLAFQVGECGEDTVMETRLVDLDEMVVSSLDGFDGAAVTPVGWLDDTLIVKRFANGCDGIGDLYAWSNQPEELASDVGVAAIRAVIDNANPLPDEILGQAPA
jgi:hypothetical protein